MARQVTLSDDFDGSTPAETMEIAYDGEAFEVDLSPDHAKALRDFLAPFKQVGRSTGRGSRGKSESSSDNKLIREWAEKEGIEVSATGRISKKVRDKYDEAMRGKNGDTPSASDEADEGVTEIPTLA